MSGCLAERYEILAELGRGGMGRVYKAYDLELGEIVAIKTLIAPDDVFGEEPRLLREVQICRRISHPNVVRVYDIGRFEGGLFVTMEYIDGMNLEAVIAEESPLPFARVRSILSEIASGLQEAHAQGIVHRDLKPANVMVTGSRLKILDFGIAVHGRDRGASHPDRLRDPPRRLPAQPAVEQPFQSGLLVTLPITSELSLRHAQQLTRFHHRQLTALPAAQHIPKLLHPAVLQPRRPVHRSVSSRRQKTGQLVCYLIRTTRLLPTLVAPDLDLNRPAPLYRRLFRGLALAGD